MSNTGCDSGRGDLRKRKSAVQEQLGERNKKCKTKSPADTKASAEGGQEVLQVWSRSFLKCRRGPQWSMGSVLLHLSCCTVLLQPMEHHTEQTSMCSHGGVYCAALDVA